jgi:flavin reductase (DIM6/NTAB) family NADH-FMN oxidoreductase RutF
MLFDASQLQQMESRYRAAFVNSLSGFKAANLIGSCDASGHSNLAIMSSAVHLGSHPPLLMLVLRPSEARQHTLDNVLATGSYTINHVAREFYPAAHQTAARYPRDVSEFSAVGLTPHWQAGVTAPFVAEASIRMGMELREHQPLAINGTQLLIGEVVSVEVPDAVVEADGSIDIAAAGTVALSGLDRYYAVESLGRLPYAKP